jgi:hypothetical protein
MQTSKVCNVSRPKCLAWTCRLRLVMFSVIFCAALLSAGYAFSSPPASALIDLEHRWVEALKTHNKSELDAILDDTFVDTTFRGALRTKNDVLSGPTAGGPYHSIRLENLSVRMYGKETAIVTGVNVLQGASEKDIARISFTDVFVKRGDRWKAVSAQETLQATN